MNLGRIISGLGRSMAISFLADQMRPIVHALLEGVSPKELSIMIATGKSPLDFVAAEIKADWKEQITPFKDIVATFLSDELLLEVITQESTLHASMVVNCPGGRPWLTEQVEHFKDEFFPPAS